MFKYEIRIENVIFSFSSKRRKYLRSLIKKYIKTKDIHPMSYIRASVSDGCSYYKDINGLAYDFM